MGLAVDNGAKSSPTEYNGTFVEVYTKSTLGSDVLQYSTRRSQQSIPTFLATFDYFYVVKSTMALFYSLPTALASASTATAFAECMLPFRAHGETGSGR
jgi:hypothetical protein